MSLWRTFKVAWEGLTLNKARSFLTTLGVIIGVGAVIVMMAVSAGAEAEIAEQINALGANLIVVMPAFNRGGFGPGSGRMPGLTLDDMDAIAQNVIGINGVSAEQTTTQDIKGGDTVLESISVVGTTADFTEVRDYAVAEGRFLTDEDNDRANRVIVLGYDVAQEFFGGQNAVGQSIKIGSTVSGATFTVVGVMGEKGLVGSTDYDGRVYVPLTVVFKKFTSSRFGGDTIRTILASVIMGAIVFWLQQFIETPLISLVLLIPLGFVLQVMSMLLLGVIRVDDIEILQRILHGLPAPLQGVAGTFVGLIEVLVKWRNKSALNR